MYEVGISSCSKTIDEKLFEEYAKNGIKHIEVSEAGGGSDIYEDYDFKRLLTLTKNFGVNLWSLHLPFYPFATIEPSSLDKAVRDNTVEKFSKIINQGSEIGINKYVIHPSGEPIADAERSERLKRSRETLSRLADVCEKVGATLCAEDLPRTCLGRSIEEMRFLTEDDRVKICFDTNHITVQSPKDVIDALGSKIVTLHVSDYDFVDEKHWLPGEGKIDWVSVMAALKNAKYNGVFMYELGYQCPKTIVRDRDLTAADFRRNADELFSGKGLTVLGKTLN